MDKKTILIIEDDIEVRRLLKFLLEKDNYSVVEIGDGQEACERLGLAKPAAESPGLQVIEPSLILLDIVLPNVDGYSILSKLLQYENTRNIPVIVVSVKSQMADLLLSNANVKHFFPKPFDPKILRTKIREILA
ncbi:MAG: hypothetical protein AUJ85_09090 [Elusimicrobia bacterium CG1_02_37_114]|nr:MAG: hypothetical protein AUJ85_09090 [Elusimicrobia bacterium CG1_02_37_114]PIV53808.1 MAG: hypothetical protein COS17_01975 [Elusimicrobia bacterium CG02_land_8_20_14_3_00_37_13]PIZ13961.1 MAG: hypothetical protein COY53_02125 [Elusimicrobia bacterium CG_4_10_14_0_8_um_filter_37_32]